MTEQTDSSTERRRSLHEDTDEAICEALLRRLGDGENPDLDELLAGIDEPRRSKLRAKLELCRDSLERSQASPSEDTTDWTADSAAAEVSSGYDAIERLGRYRIEGTLGRGAFGQVFLARDEHLKRLVAIKTPRSGRVGGVHDIEKFKKEAQVLAQLDHAAIVPVYDYGTTDNHRCYVVSKYIDGNDLAARIQTEQPSIAQAAQWVASIAEALHHAHTKRLVHRDVKPGNILLDQDDKPYLADFGLALREEDFGRGSPYAGTVYYMSPEQARGEGHRVDGRSDVFSLGVVLYLLLTGQRPFTGVDKNAVLERIVKHDVQPPRQKNDRIPKELERIVLHSLAKRASDRYATAQDMADDLRYFLAEYGDIVDGVQSGLMLSDGDSMTNVRPVMPKGLRSFDSSDAEFFLNLLPGPYDRYGLPQIVRFWKRQIELMGGSETFRVGLIYGPSGCGKSSLVKAGILPHLTPNIHPVVLEATPEDTEAKLLRLIRQRCPDVSQQADLTDTLTEIRRGAGLPAGEKLLIVIDQFEQWMHARNEYSDTPLCQALRQCDGQRVQCILLVRDDFWMSATRFMREVEVQIVEGQNSTVVDLFDKRHARKVLSAFGRAYGALPARVSETSQDQKRFLRMALDDLAHEGKVISVHLVLFAEMVRDKPWTPDTLRRVGGIQGIGVTFLEEAFNSTNATAAHRLHQTQARAVLAALLPELGTDIKGHTRSYDELFTVSGCGSQQEFTNLMQVLNADLRLLTPAEAQKTGFEAATANPEEKSYQLAHDYLVAALRQWLTRKQRETRRGRAGLLLAERAEFWHAKPERKQLPSFLEWLSIVLHTRRSEANDTQHKMMWRATWMHLMHAALVLLALIAVGAAGVQAYRYEHSANLVARAMDADPSVISTVVEDMEHYRGWVDRLLRDADAGGDPQKELALLLVKRPLDQADVDLLVDRLLHGAPDHVRVIRETLAAEAPDVASLTDDLWTILENTDGPQYERFRAACALAEFDPKNQRWETSCSEVAAWLVSQTPVLIDRWGALLQPAQQSLVAPLKVLFHDSQEVLALNAATLLCDYLHDDVEELVQLNRTASTAQRRVLVDALRDHKDRQVAIDLLHAELERNAGPDAKDDERAVVARERSRAATILMLLGEPDRVWPLLVQDLDDPQVRTCLLHDIAWARIEPDLLIDRLQKEQSPSLKIGLILSLAEYKSTSFSERHLTRLVPMLLERFKEDPNSGVHSACECLLRRLGHAKEIADISRQSKRQEPAEGQDWYVAPSGDTMAVFRNPPSFVMGTPRGRTGWLVHEDARETQIPRSFAIATKEVTYKQFRVMWGDYRVKVLGDTKLEHPVDLLDFHTMMGYCQWLSESQEIDPDQYCYERLPEWKLRPYPDFLERTGYRLPTEAEWEYACRAGTTTLRHDGYGTEFVRYFTWYGAVDADSDTLPVGSLLPNDWGLFDVYGNAAEFCQNIYSEEYSEEYVSDVPVPIRVVRGRGYGGIPSVYYSARRDGNGPSARGALGFRIARTVYTIKDTPKKGEQ